MNNRRRNLARRAVAGARATAPMSMVFSAFDAVGWLGQMPPRQIVQRLTPNLPGPVTSILTWVAHFGYGGVLGAGYSLFSRSPSPVRGAGFGLAVGLINYEFLLPLLRIRQPLHRDDPREIVALLVAHLVYGADLGRRLAGDRVDPITG